MMDDQQHENDPFSKQLAAWDEALEQGRSVEESTLQPQSQFLDAKLNKGLACLKLLNNLRTKKSGISIGKNIDPALADFKVSAVDDPLPCRFGKFELLRELGRGGFGVVFLAKDTVLDCEVALKMPHPHVLTDDQLRARFLREARVAAGLQHPNIVPVREAGQVGPVNYIVYAYCSGMSLREWMRQQKDPVSPALAAQWVADLAEALEHAHNRGVLHRDLKPTNILLHEEPGIPAAPQGSYSRPTAIIPKITDFGLAKLECDKQQTATGAIVGTPTYMAPEQTSGKGKIGAAADIHALGAMLYELLVGRPPFRGETDMETLQLVNTQEPLAPRKLRPKLPRDLETICLKCLEKEPRHRYARAADLAADLRAFLQGNPIQARPISLVERGWRACRRHPVVSVLAFCLIVAIGGGLAGILWQSHHRQIQADVANAWLQKYQDLLDNDVASAQAMMQNPQTEKQGREKLLESLKFFDELLKDPQSQPGLQLRTARLARQAAFIHHTLGQYPQAVARYQQSAELLHKLRKNQSSTENLTLEHAGVVARMAFTYRIMKRYLDSENHYRQALAIATQEYGEEPENAEALAFLSRTLIFNCVNLREQKRPEEAKKDYERSLDFIQRALEQHPDDPKLLLDKAFAADDYSDFCMAQEKWDEAERFVKLGLELRKSIFERMPKTYSSREELARSYWRLARLWVNLGRVDEAVANYQVTIDMNDQLRKDFPGVPQCAHNAAYDRHLLCSVLEGAHRFDQAKTVYEQALEIRKKCAQEYPSFESNRVEYGILHFRYGGMLRKTGDLVQAEQQEEAGLEILERLARDVPDKVQYSELLMQYLLRVARQFEAAQKAEKTDAAYRRYLQKREQIAQEFSQNIQLQRDLDGAYLKLADLQQRARRWMEAEFYFSRAAAVREQVSRMKESTPRDRLVLATRYNSWAVALKQLGEDTRALELLKQGLDIAVALDPANPELVSLAQDHSRILMDIGHIHWKLKNKNALNYYLQALPLREQVFRKKDTKASRNNLAKCHFHLYQVYWEGDKNFLSAAKHYLASSTLDPVYCKPIVDPNLMLRLTCTMVSLLAQGK